MHQCKKSSASQCQSQSKQNIWMPCPCCQKAACKWAKRSLKGMAKGFHIWMCKFDIIWHLSLRFTPCPTLGVCPRRTDDFPCLDEISSQTSPRFGHLRNMTRVQGWICLIHVWYMFDTCLIRTSKGFHCIFSVTLVWQIFPSPFSRHISWPCLSASKTWPRNRNPAQWCFHWTYYWLIWLSYYNIL